ncbi:MAG: hypothetical protein FD143_470 [Ignavibacteria bacterium]|nr:MAG: hypothetical protein FD143_470 [Ignavibacteria bacterium]KAF0161541.1 MAG: hypothetical protein FD188_658 [Ignavibacteria bacterium]
MVNKIVRDGILTTVYNDMNERIEIVGDITLNLEYWDCECVENYIHPITENHCEKCNALEEDSPNSRENEVIEYIHRILPQQ